MSAYIVSNKTIDAIIYGARTWNRTTPLNGINVWSNPDEVGQMLLDQNYASVNYHYGEDEKAPRYHFPISDMAQFGILMLDEDVTFTLGEVYGCVRCYRYQACETPDWNENPVKWWLDSLEGELTSAAFQRLHEDIPWGID